VRWGVLAIFLIGMASSLSWYETRTSERRIVYGVVAITAFVLVLVLGNTMF